MISIHSFVTNKSIEEVCEEADQLNTGQYVDKYKIYMLISSIIYYRYKLIVAEAVVEYLKPIQQNITRYMSNLDYLTAVLKQGNEKAQAIASVTWEEVQYKLGLKWRLDNKHKFNINKS